ncbi:hypothetical protein LEWO105114_01755 [Legionella worsleiensis]|nr:Uncharacterised protein [Legionella worsleiensis]
MLYSNENGQAMTLLFDCVTMLVFRLKISEERYDA